MVPFTCASGGLWLLVMLGFFVFMMVACFLFRRVFHGGAFCCGGGPGRRTGREIRQNDREGGR